MFRVKIKSLRSFTTSRWNQSIWSQQQGGLRVDGSNRSTSTGQWLHLTRQQIQSNVESLVCFVVLLGARKVTTKLVIPALCFFLVKKHLSKTRHSWDFLGMGKKTRKPSSTLLVFPLDVVNFGVHCVLSDFLRIPYGQKGIWPGRSTSSTEARVRPHWQRGVEHGKRIYGCFRPKSSILIGFVHCKPSIFGGTPILETPYYINKTVGKKNRLFSI